MDYTSLKESFHKKVYPSHPNDWEVDDILHDLIPLEEEQQDNLLQAVPAIWPISHSLCMSFLHEGARQSEHLNKKRLSEWLRQILSRYEEGGLIKARAYMAEDELQVVVDHQEQSSVNLNNNISRLSSYARGISGINLEIQAADKAYTDTEVLYLPEKIDVFNSANDNVVFYKLLIAIQCSFVTQGTLSPLSFVEPLPVTESVAASTDAQAVDQFFAQFKMRELAGDIFQLAELARAMDFIKHEYPGLLRESLGLRQTLLRRRKSVQNTKNHMMEFLFCWIFLPEKRAKNHEFDSDGLTDLPQYEEKSSCYVKKIYKTLTATSGDYQQMSFLPVMDHFHFEEAISVRERRVEKNKKKFETLLSQFLINKNISSEVDKEQNDSTLSVDSVKLQISEGQDSRQSKKTASMTIDNESIDLPDELVDLMNTIKNDLGILPQGYVSAAFGLSGGGKPATDGGVQSSSPLSPEFIAYDEWDYRRHGYRKNWCGLRERVLPSVRSDFVARTLVKYRGELRKIQKQFEMMHTQERFARRRRHGDDIDLDALIDSLGDQHAGLPPSEKLFIRLLRDERSISTVFLVDMSNSTEGWVGIAIKEALVLLCEAMETVGDRYAIYGFSGMRRSRSEVYRIKEATESYGENIKARIGSISPKEYTRMGTPIRHMIKYFSKEESKTRLLILLSDGKPEDYDDYKGQYAIEDTRKALAEAKGEGIHTFCITIDKEAHTYLQHLFGRGNYLFVQDIFSLPSRLTEIYRLLTR